MKQRSWKVLASLLAVLLLQPLLSTATQAASKELSPTAKSALTKMAESAASTQASSINSMYSELISLQSQSLQRDSTLKQMQAKNKKT